MFTLTFDRAPSWGWLSPGTIIAFVSVIFLAVAAALLPAGGVVMLMARPRSTPSE